MRLLLTAIVCATVVLAADLVFRTSLLSHVNPVVFAPSSDTAAIPPVEVQWDGPHRMRVTLSATNGAREDLGVLASPAVIGADHFPAPGEYRIDLEDLVFGDWVRATRTFRVLDAPATGGDRASAPEPQPVPVHEVTRALEAARIIRTRAQDRVRFLREENKALRNETERMARELEKVYTSQESDADRAGQQQERIAQLAAGQRELAEENAALRLRLSGVVPCSVWGYYSLTRLHAATVPRQILMVADGRGQVFRFQPQCEVVRRADPTASSACQCVGNSWGG